MSKDFMLISDITCDLPQSWYLENDARWLLHGLVLEGREYWDEFGSVITPHEAAQQARAKKVMSTLQVRLEDFVELFTQAAKSGRDAVYVGFSSALSGTFSTAQIAADMVREVYPDCEIYCVDSLAATMGHGIQVIEAARLRALGQSASQVAQAVQARRLEACHFFTVDDLFHLQRGGRLSRTSATMGSLMGIKPILYVSDEGRLTPLSKVRGRKASMHELAKLTAQYIDMQGDRAVYITHGDVPDEAEELADCIREQVPGAKVSIAQLSPIIAVHSGPGTLTSFFWGKKRI